MRRSVHGQQRFRPQIAGRALLLALVAITIVPFLSIFTTALHPSGAVPSGLSWPDEPQWGNFVEAFQVANMSALLASIVFIVLAPPRGTCSGASTCLLRGRRSPRWASSRRQGHGINSCSPWSSSRIPPGGPWPARWARSEGHYATDIPLLCAGTILIPLPTLVAFILFQRQVIAALLQGSVKG